MSFFPFLFEMLLPGSRKISFIDISPLPSSPAVPELAQPTSCRTASPGGSPWSSPLLPGRLSPSKGLLEGQNAPKLPHRRVLQEGSCTRGMDRGYSLPRHLQISVASPLCCQALPPSHRHSLSSDTSIPPLSPRATQLNVTQTSSPFPSPPGDATAVGHFPGAMGQAAPHSYPVPGRAPQLPLPPGAE